MKSYRKHIFICNGKTCSSKGSEEVLKRLRELIDEKGLKDTVKSSKGGCFGVCGETDPKGGFCPTSVIYPEGVWYHNVTLENIGEIVDEHLVNGRIVERLLHHRM
ncbi:MAG: (2Fe-2S) ferredoxin domain-containing protein [Nitrospirota bacterium]|nr:(2Fe-2S) ferredoxin domain-containing protein [Nitrospirota bacterium]